MINHPTVTFKKEQLQALMAKSGHVPIEQSDTTYSAMKQFGLIPGRLLTDIEVAKIMKCSVQFLRNQRSTGTGTCIPYLKWNRCVRYMPEDVYAAIMASRIVPTN